MCENEWISQWMNFMRVSSSPQISKIKASFKWTGLKHEPSRGTRSSGLCWNVRCARTCFWTGPASLNFYKQDVMVQMEDDEVSPATRAEHRARFTHFQTQTPEPPDAPKSFSLTTSRQSKGFKGKTPWRRLAQGQLMQQEDFQQTNHDLRISQLPAVEFQHYQITESALRFSCSFIYRCRV